MPRLLVNPGTPQQWEVRLRPGVNTLGRSPGCDFQIEHASVSGTHCQITIQGDAVKLKDLGSTNGTFLERAPVSEAPLTLGQRLQLGGVEMQLVADPPESADAVPARLPLLGTEAPPPSSPPAPRVRLRVAGSATPPLEPAVPPPPAYVPDEYSVSPTGPAMCKYHPKSVARWLCPHCQLSFCDLCVTSRPGGAHGGYFCRRCSGECVALNVQLVPEHVRKGNFFTMVPGAFAYPFKGNGVWFMALGSIFFAVVQFLGRFSFWLQVIFTGYLFAYMQKVIQTAAQGDDEAASWPDVSEFWQDIILPFLQLVATIVVCFGPSLALILWAGVENVKSGTADPTKLLLVVPLAIGGAVYFPMALLAVAMFDSVTALSPHVVLPAMFKAPLEYLVVLVLLAILFLIRVAEAVLLSVLIPIPFVPDAIASGIGLYFLTVQMRLLGLMYYAKRERLGWFSRR